MTSSSHRTTQVRYKPNFLNFYFYLFFVFYCTHNLPSYHTQMLSIDTKIPHNTKKNPENANIG